MTTAVPAAEARALPSSTPRPVDPLVSASAVAPPARIASPRAPDPARITPPASRSNVDRASTPSAAAQSGEPARADAAETPVVVRNAAGRAIDPAVADRLRADPLVRQVTDILDAPVQRVVPRRVRAAPTQDGEE